MADLGIFDRIAPDKPPAEEKKAPSKDLGVFDRLKDKPTAAAAGPSFGEKALKFGKGAVKEGLGIATNVGNIAGFGIPRALESKEQKEFRERITTPKGGAEKAGASAVDVGTMLVPIPGLEEVGAGANLGRLGKLALRAAKSGGEVGAKSLATGASPKEAATTAAIAGPVGAATEATVPYLSGLLKKLSRSQYGKVLHPLGGKAKEVAEDVLPDVVQAGKSAIGFTKTGLSQKFTERAEEIGQQIAQKYQALDATTRTRIGPIYQDFNDWVLKNAYTKGGALKDPMLLQAAFEKLDYLQDTLGSVLATARPSEVQEIRQTLDKYIYPNGLTAEESLNAANQVRRALANSIRNQLNKQHPDLKALNNSYHLWARTAELMQRNVRNEIGKLQFARNTGIIGRFLMGAAIGEETSRHEGAPIWGTATAAALGGLAFESTGWRTVSAVTKAKIADLLMRGEGKAAAALAARATGVLRGQADKRMNKGDRE